MKATDLKCLLETTGLPVAYGFFNEIKSPPYITFQFVRTNNIFADNKVQAIVNDWQIDLYTKIKDVNTEELLESAFSDYCWNKSETYIDAENLYLITYDLEEIQ